MEGICTTCGAIVDLESTTEHKHVTAIMTAVLAMFSTRLAVMAPYAGAMDILNKHSNWAGIVALRDQLVTATTITQQEADDITQIYADNGIIIDDPLP